MGCIMARNVFSRATSIFRGTGKTAISIPSTAVDVGFTVGGDVNWFRSAPSVWSTDANIVVNGNRYVAAGTLVCYATDGSGYFLGYLQSPDPTVPANSGGLFFRNSGGKVQLCVKFPTGVAQVIATEL